MIQRSAIEKPDSFGTFRFDRTAHSVAIAILCVQIQVPYAVVLFL